MPDFAQRLIDWQQRHGRHDLPWQASREPYRVWLSEIMLQQTQVDTVVAYYQRFLAHFPTLADLAAAPLSEVLALWSGLGYYARARNLHRAAQCIAADHGGVFPASSLAIAELPGIGRSTAAAIAVFCFGERAAILDGNVKRVLSRHFAMEGFPGLRTVEQALWARAESLLPRRDVDTYTQALMDLGATVCTRSRPRCGECPVAASCLAHRQGREADFPAPRPKKTIPERSTHVLLAVAGDAVLLAQRPPQGIWGGLLALPEVPDATTPADFAARLGLTPLEITPQTPVRHAFTHFRLTLHPWRCAVADATPLAGGFQWAPAASWDTLGLPAPIRRLLDGEARACSQ